MVQKGVSLKKYNTFGIDAQADNWLEVETEEDLIFFLKNNPLPDLPIFPLGGGSNLLLTQNQSGLIIKINILGKKIISENNNSVLLEIGAGENWHDLTQYCIQNDWGGIENLSLIPGSVGASPVQNIGAYGVELKDVFDSLDAVRIETGKKEQFDRKNCAFGYRNSVFKQEAKGKYIITKVRLRLTKSPHAIHSDYGAIQSELKDERVKSATIADISRIICKIRSSKLPDPKEIGNSGSFFKNPVVKRELFENIWVLNPEMPHYILSPEEVKIPAGWLIEQCGWKGKRFGDAGIHPKQALVLVNYGNASGEEIFKLSEKIIKSVYKKFSINLDREVNIL